MNVSKLKEGMVVKSYKELCKTLEVKEKKGNTRKKQLEDFKRYFDYTREKYTFIINTIHEFPKIATIDQHLENFLLVNLVKSCKSNDSNFLLFGTKSTYYKMLALVNNNYKEYAFNPSAISKSFEIQEDNAIDLCNILNDTLYYKFKTLISKLERKRIIISEEVYVGCIVDKDGHTYKETTNEEKEIYMKINSKVLKELKCKDFQEVYKDGKLKEYNESISKYLQKELGVNYVFKCYKIFFHDDFIKDRLKDIYKQYAMTDKEIKHEIETINKSFMKQFKENGENRNKKAFKQTELIQEYIDFDIFDKKTSKLLNRSKKSYLDDVDKFIKALIQLTGLKTLQEIKEMFEQK